MDSFGYSYKSLIAGKLSEKIFAEPPHVVIIVTSAVISVSKTTIINEGDKDKVDSLTPFTFFFKQNDTPLANVKYTIGGSDEIYRTGENGSFTLTSAQTATLYVTPGSGYTVEETLLPLGFTLNDIILH